MTMFYVPCHAAEEEDEDANNNENEFGEETKAPAAIPDTLVEIVQFVPLSRHVCCRFGPLSKDRDSITGIWASIPTPRNNTGVLEHKCATVTPYTKEEAACRWCSCMWKEGAKKKAGNQYEKCCSLTKLQDSGFDEKTGWSYCQKETHSYNIGTDTIRSCELNIDLYEYSTSFSSSASCYISVLFFMVRLLFFFMLPPGD